ncbi:MAG: alpha/beta hydrolase family protein, partial [Pyrinomonadaceae bacterium]
MNFGKYLVSLVLVICLHIISAAQTVSSNTISPNQGVSSDEIVLPTPTGSYRVGRASFHRIDTSRIETFTADPTDHRQVLFQIWYPAEATGGTVAPYVDQIPHDEVFRYSFVGIDRLLKTRAHAIKGVKVSRTRKRYPVIIFSHGLGRVAAHYTAFLENLASHGYVVVGVDSPFFSSALKMPDGRIIQNKSQRNQRSGAREEEAVIQAQDLIFVLNELERIDETDVDIGLGRRLDLRHVGVFGHSRGGFAAPHACLLDSRFRACLNLDGYPLTPALMEKGIRQPYMHIEEIEPWEPPATNEELARVNMTRAEEVRAVQEAKRRRETLFSKMPSGVYLVTVKGAAHNSFSDMPFIAPERWSNIEINAARALTITNTYLVAFFDRYLKGRPQSLLKASDPMFPEVTVKVYRQGKHN